MVLKVESLSDSPNESLRVKGSLGDLQISGEDSGDSDDDKTCDTEKVSRAVSTIPSGLVKETSVPVFGSVAVANSENIQFGNNTYFNGPVVIKQIIQRKTGVENASYVPTEDDVVGASAPTTSSDKTAETATEKEPVLLWHKLIVILLCVTVIGGIAGIIVVVGPKISDEAQEGSVTSPHPDLITDSSRTTDIPVTSTVVGYCYVNYQFVISLMLLPLTFLLIYNSLLTKTVSVPKLIMVEVTTHKSYLVKSCTKSKAEGTLIVAPEHLRIVPRTDWLAQPAEAELSKLILPAPWIIIAHTATASCFSQSQCVYQVRQIQTYHIESKGWSDIGYNFLVGGDGSAYYGRGWDFEGAHTKYYNKFSIGIAFIGTFNNDPPSKLQVEACKKLIRLGVSLGKVAKDYKLLAHRQFMSTLSPGDKVYDIIKTWPHFENSTDFDELLPEDRRPKVERKVDE